jgi:hypothetical protein
LWHSIDCSINFSTEDVLFYPQLAIGGGYSVVFIVTNKSESNWSGIAKPLLNDGSLDYLRTPIELNPKETKKFIFSGGATGLSTALQIEGNPGYAPATLSVAYFFSFSESGNLKDTIGVPKGVSSSKFTFPVEKSAATDTGLAIRRRTNQVDSPITLTLLDASGTQVQQVIQKSDFSIFFTQLFAAIPNQFFGSMTAESQDEFYLVVMRLEYVTGGFQLTSVPPEPN